jgi:hypothetical protein
VGVWAWALPKVKRQKAKVKNAIANAMAKLLTFESNFLIFEF